MSMSSCHKNVQNVCQTARRCEKNNVRMHQTACQIECRKRCLKECHMKYQKTLHAINVCMYIHTRYVKLICQAGVWSSSDISRCAGSSASPGFQTSLVSKFIFWPGNISWSGASIPVDDPQQSDYIWSICILQTGSSHLRRFGWSVGFVSLYLLYSFVLLHSFTVSKPQNFVGLQLTSWGFLRPKLVCCGVQIGWLQNLNSTPQADIAFVEFNSLLGDHGKMEKNKFHTGPGHLRCWVHLSTTSMTMWVANSRYRRYPCPLHIICHIYV